MIVIYPAGHERHDPPFEFLEGSLTPFTDTPRRATTILQATSAAGIGPVIAPDKLGLEPILAVHSAPYLHHLRTIQGRWHAEGFGTVALPSVLPVRELQRSSPALHAQVGYYAFDLSAPVAAATFEVALASAHAALSGARLLREGQRFVYALCRPPGHHAHRELMGGFCYLNNAAIAANELAANGTVRVALLDIDVHAGNGSQAIFYERGDVLFLSIHGAPEWEYPYFSGFADERGAGAGAGATRNYPLPPGIGDAAYLAVLGEALDAVAAFGARFLVLSAGFDAYEHDPLSKLRLTTLGFAAIGRQIASLNLPTLVVQEGGYAVDDLGRNVVSLLEGLERG